MNPADLVSAFPPGERTVPAMLQRQAQRYGNRPLFVAGEVSWSFAEAPAIAARLCRVRLLRRASGPATGWR